MNRVRKNETAILFIIVLVVIFLILDWEPLNKMTKDIISAETVYPDSSHSFSILTANVGNLSWGCRKVLNKLCYKDVEKRIAANIQSLNPDIVALQEVLAPWQCSSELRAERDSKMVCADPQEIEPQIRRLLGKDYTIVCDSRNQFECIGVRVESGEILGCEIGELCNNTRTNWPIQGCDNGFTISAATIRLSTGLIFDIVNAHPQSTSSLCRAKMLKQIFSSLEDSTPLVHQELVLLVGDFNLDPWHDNDVSAKTWRQIFNSGWKGRRFVYHSGIVEKAPPHITAKFLWKKKTVDFVVSNFAKGVCVVLGESPGTQRLDGGRGTDHRAIWGVLEYSLDNR